MAQASSSNTNIKPNTPILVGVGQSLYRGKLQDAGGLNLIELVAQASAAALEDSQQAQLLTEAIDCVVVNRFFGDSSPGLSHAFGACENFPASLSSRLAITPKEMVYADVGGHSPQRLINEASKRLYDGEVNAVLIAGAEANDLVKQALRAGEILDWSEAMPESYAEIDYDDRGLGKPFMGMANLANGISLPTNVYPLFENAWRHRQGITLEQQRALIGELFSKFADVAANNPYSQFPEQRSAEFLATPSRENYEIALPHLKWHVAQDAVNQGAAAIVTTVAAAQAMGIPESQWVGLSGYGDADEALVTARSDLSRSPMVSLAADSALNMAGQTVDDMSAFDIYSCFPCAVIFACEALGIDWQKESRALTLTGGLPLFGGAGNNYSMHGIAEAVQLARQDEQASVMVFANGGYLSKASVGIYSKSLNPDWQPNVDPVFATDDAKAQGEEYVLQGEAVGTVSSYTVVYKKGQPFYAFATVNLDNGECVAAAVPPGDEAQIAALESQSPIGTTANVQGDGKRNFLQLDAAFLGGAKG